MTDRLVTEVRRDGRAGIIDLIGDLDGDAGAALPTAYEQAADGADRVILNFARMGFMNSSGIALVVELLGRARSAGLSVHAIGLSEHYSRIFEITRLSDFMTIHADEASAVA
ncbi:MAG TPA: STAS domain-containing protein [Candidatus Limnocylindria bacterium]|nr:STAS domain-containing protein [Candidatus Limnocylindria bacterium]